MEIAQMQMKAPKVKKVKDKKKKKSSDDHLPPRLLQNPEGNAEAGYSEAAESKREI